jgi:hypothetical protein
MAKCDEGYLCSVCGEEVKRLIDSSLYLQYVIGWIEPQSLHRTPDIHLRCNPSLSQFIQCSDFQPPVSCEGDFDFKKLDSEFVRQRTQLITQGYLRLRHLQRDRSQPIQHYPLLPGEERPVDN